MLQAFLQRLVNGGGPVEREYGLGRGRTDLLLFWRTPDGLQKIGLELKILRHSRERTLAEGLEQTWQYLDRVGERSGHLVIFDRRVGPWAEKIYRQEETWRGRRITGWGC